jgi:hypothetical protein
MEEDIWKTFISALDFNLSEKGLVAPDIESIEDDAGSVSGMLLKISFDITIFMNHGQEKYYMIQSNQKLTQLGESTLKDVLIKYNKKIIKK